MIQPCDTTENYLKLLVAESDRYFGQTLPALVAQWQANATSLTISVSPELLEHPENFGAILTERFTGKLRITLAAATERSALAEPWRTECFPIWSE